MKYPLLILLIIAVFASCRKENGIASPEVQNVWSYKDTTLKAVFSEVNLRKGYFISFHSEGVAGLEYGITFQFTGRPAESGTYAVTRSVTDPGQVKVTLETGTLPGYYSAENSGQLNASLSDGKLVLKGDRILMVRDTVAAYADTLRLKFSLKEF